MLIKEPNKIRTIDMQADFFEALTNDPLDAENAPILDFSLDMIAVVKQCERNSGLLRPQIVDRINLCLRDTGHVVSSVAYNKWMGASQVNNIPAHILPAICWALNSAAPLEMLAQSIGRKVIDMRGDAMRQMTEMNLSIAAQQKEAKQLQKTMQQMVTGSK